MCVCVCVCVCVCEGGVTPPNFLKFVGILMRYVGKIPRLNVVGKFGLFYHKKMKSRILSICSPTEIKLLQVVTPFKEVI